MVEQETREGKKDISRDDGFNDPGTPDRDAGGGTGDNGGDGRDNQEP